MFWVNLHWAFPLGLALVLLIGLGVWLQFYFKARPALRFSSLLVYHDLIRAAGMVWKYLPGLLRILGLVVLTLVLARPQLKMGWVERKVKAADLVLVLDLSSSMRADDLAPSRVQAAKAVLKQFIRKRQQDRIGLVVFSGTAQTLAPLTFDTDALLQSLDEVDTDTQPMEGTAIGEALLVAGARLTGDTDPGQASQPDLRHSAIILATDGTNNTGIDPLLAAKVLALKGIKLYTIGVGGDEDVPRFARDDQGNRVWLRDIYGKPQYWQKADTASLQQLADLTHGQFFRAGNREAFSLCLDAIDRMEKKEIQQKQLTAYQEAYGGFLCFALVCFIGEFVLRATRSRTLLDYFA